MTDFDPTLTDRFENCEIAPANFGHRDHLQVAFEMLKRYDFIEACVRYGRTISHMAEGVGAPEKYNATITIAFLSLVGERLFRFTGSEFASFLTSNPDLLDKHILETFYTKERLSSQLSRTQFLMPDRLDEAKTVSAFA